MMSTTKLKPFHDPRVTLRSAHLNGYNYGYIHANPSSTPHRGTIILIHGFPDISFGWRNQIPLLSSLGLEVIALDCLGYGRSDSPPTSEISAYTCRRIADDISELCRQLSLSSIILGGHDWGGMIVYRVALYYPKLIRAFFSICTPYTPPTPTFTPLEVLVKEAVPNFRYQVQFASGEVERKVKSASEIRQFLHSSYGARTAENKEIFDAEKGVALDLLPSIGKTRLLSDDEMDLYVQEYSRHGINGPLNWYRVREANFIAEYEHFFASGRKEPKEEIRVEGVEVLFVQAMKDSALKPYMSKKMEERIEKLTWRKVDAGHWVLWQKPEIVNGFIAEWLKSKVFEKEAGTKSKL